MIYLKYDPWECIFIKIKIKIKILILIYIYIYKIALLILNSNTRKACIIVSLKCMQWTLVTLGKEKKIVTSMPIKQSFAGWVWVSCLKKCVF